MAKVYGQIVLYLELDELSVLGTQLDLEGIGRKVQACVQELPMHGKQLRLIEVDVPTKDWQIEANLRVGERFFD